MELLGIYSGPQLEVGALQPHVENLAPQKILQAAASNVTCLQHEQVMQVLVDIGTDDNFLKEQLEPEALKNAAQGKLKLELRMQVSVMVLIWRPLAVAKMTIGVAYGLACSNCHPIS